MTDYHNDPVTHRGHSYLSVMTLTKEIYRRQKYVLHNIKNKLSVIKFSNYEMYKLNNRQF